MIYQGTNNEYLELRELKPGVELTFDTVMYSGLILVWVGESGGRIAYEGETKDLAPYSILCLSVFHKFELLSGESVRMIKFNREFYCIMDHDSEVSCKGLLFYGAHRLPVFQIPETDRENFEILWRMFTLEMASKDDMQLEMLQTMLKRLLILCTRLYKNQYDLQQLDKSESDLVREFHFLVEHHFKTLHTVKDYADLLHKSPKTLANLFAKVSEKSPLRLIHERKLLEARRLLRYTDKPVKEIAYELGFEDVQAFSRFFKKGETVSPTDFRNVGSGTIANTSGGMT